MSLELCSECGHELPNDTGPYCPVCGEPRFTDCRRGRAAMDRGCECDACVAAADEELHRQREEGLV